MSDAPVLTEMPVSQIVTFWRPGSHDWTWAEEYADVMADDKIDAIRQRVMEGGIGFQDHVAPVLLGSDGRVWDGHHRICIAIGQGIRAIRVEKAGGDDA